jgi:ubiquinone/menaquinone biosynthesis C-methylase UbiE
MGVRDRTLARLAGQLGGPHGLTGRLVARRLDRINATSIAAAVHSLAPPVGGTVADVGFGGGVGLGLLAEAVGPSGVVHGVDPMAGMVRRAARRWADLVAADRLVVQAGRLEELPLDDAVLDGAITCNTIYFVADLEAGLAELGRVLRPGGIVVIGMADPEYLEATPVAQHGFAIRDAATVAEALGVAGFGAPTLEPVDIERATFQLLRAESAS